MIQFGVVRQFNERVKGAIRRRMTARALARMDFYLPRVSGVIHVGGHLAEERDIYADRGLNVFWVEANPKLYPELLNTISNHPNQRASCDLLMDTEGKRYDFYISSNNGESSSVLEIAGHKEIWTQVSYVETIPLTSTTLSGLVKREKLDLSRYDSLVMDTQGSELHILKGATDILDQFKFIKTEVADFDLYKGCCRLSDMDQFLDQHHFRRVRTWAFARKAGLGAVYDAVYSRTP
jgi:FkbM family methyltransferase